MKLTLDQLHSFQTSQRFGDFRQLFLKREDAFAAYATAAQSTNKPAKPTHQIEWRHIYHDKESGFLLLLFLITAPLGIHYTKHMEFRFTTEHEFTSQQVRRLYLGRTLGSLCYHACFILLILCGVGLFVGVIVQLFGGYNLGMTLLAILSLLAFTLLMIAAGKTRSLGLPEYLKPIAKDTFDLLSIKKVDAK